MNMFVYDVLWVWHHQMVQYLRETYTAACDKVEMGCENDATQYLLKFKQNYVTQETHCE